MLSIPSYRKWEWQLTAESLERQAAFFNFALKGPGGPGADITAYWPKVRLFVTDKYLTGSWRHENEFPLARTQRTKLYLGLNNQFAESSLQSATSLTYDYKTGSATWQRTFTSPTEITGTARLHVTFSISSGSDADLFVTLQKLDRDGNVVHFPYHTFVNDGHVAWGWLRVSKRKLDAHSIGDEVAHTFLEEDLQPLVPGEKVEADVGIQPSSTLFRKGETLRLVVQARDFGVYGPGAQIPRAGTGCNEGEHTKHLKDSYLEVPVIPFVFP
jgi:predicted acyl esterase